MRYAYIVYSHGYVNSLEWNDGMEGGLDYWSGVLDWSATPTNGQFFSCKNQQVVIAGCDVTHPQDFPEKTVETWQLCILLNNKTVHDIAV